MTWYKELLDVKYYLPVDYSNSSNSEASHLLFHWLHIDLAVTGSVS